MLCQGYGPQDASGEVSSSPPVRVEVAAAAVAAALLQTIPPTLQAAHLAEQLQVSAPCHPLPSHTTPLTATPCHHPLPSPLTTTPYLHLLPSSLTVNLQENEMRGSPLLCGLDDARLEPPFVFVVGSS